MVKKSLEIIQQTIITTSLYQQRASYRLHPFIRIIVQILCSVYLCREIGVLLAQLAFENKLKKDYKNHGIPLPPEVKACHSLAISLPQLIRRLHDFSETESLRPISIALQHHNHDYDASVPEKLRSSTVTTNVTMLFSGLDDKLIDHVFHNKSFFFIGDSTLRYLTKWLQVLLDENCGDYYKIDSAYSDVYRNGSIKSICSNSSIYSNGSISNRSNINASIHTNCAYQSWSNLSLPEANARMKNKSAQCQPSVDLFSHADPTHNHPTPTTHIEWYGNSHYTNKNMDQILIDAWNKANEVKPTILIVNMGLHWLHFMGAGRDVDYRHIKRWVYYEETWLQDSIDRAIQIKSVQLLLFKTTNLVCPDKWFGKFAEGNRKYSSSDELVLNETFTACENKTRSIIEEIRRQQNISMNHHQISRYCHNGLFNEYGSKYLNQRLYRFIATKLSEEVLRKNNLMVGIFNDHDIEFCSNDDGIHDGIHHQSLGLSRTRLLANTINCAFESISDINRAQLNHNTFQQQMIQYAHSLVDYQKKNVTKQP